MTQDEHSDESWALRAKEVQRMLNIGRNTLYELVKKGKIPHKHIGRILLFPRRPLQEWLEEQDKNDK